MDPMNSLKNFIAFFKPTNFDSIIAKNCSLDDSAKESLTLLASETNKKTAQVADAALKTDSETNDPAKADDKKTEPLKDRVSLVLYKDGTISKAGWWDSVMEFFGSAKIYDVKADDKGGFVVLQSKTDDVIKHGDKSIVIKPTQTNEKWTIEVDASGNAITSLPNLGAALAGTELIFNAPTGSAATEPLDTGNKQIIKDEGTNNETENISQNATAIAKTIQTAVEATEDKAEAFVKKKKKEAELAKPTSEGKTPISIAKKEVQIPDDKKIHTIKESTNILKMGADLDKLGMSAYVVKNADKLKEGDVLYISACGLPLRATPEDSTEKKIIMKVSTNIQQKLGNDSKKNCSYYIESFVAQFEAMNTEAMKTKDSRSDQPSLSFDERLARIAFSVPDPGARTALKAVAEHYGVDPAKVLVTSHQPQDICAALPNKGSAHYALPLGGKMETNIDGHLNGKIRSINTDIHEETYLQLCQPETLSDYSSETGVFGFHQKITIDGQQVMTPILSQFSPFKYLSLLLSEQDPAYANLAASPIVNHDSITTEGIVFQLSYSERKKITFQEITDLMAKNPEGAQFWNPDTQQLVKMTPQGILLQAIIGSQAMSGPEGKKVLLALLANSGIISDDPPGATSPDFFEHIKGQEKTVTSLALGEWQLQHALRKANHETSPSEAEVACFMIYKMTLFLSGAGIKQQREEYLNDLKTLKNELAQAATVKKDDEGAHLGPTQQPTQAKVDPDLLQSFIATMEQEISTNENSAHKHLENLKNYEEQIVNQDPASPVYAHFQEALEKLKQGEMNLPDQLALLQSISKMARTKAKTHLEAALGGNETIDQSTYCSRF